MYRRLTQTLILAHVSIPRLTETSPAVLATPQGLVHKLQQGYFAVNDVTVRRWVPARMKS